MATIVYAWELGAGYGHISGFAPVGEDLCRRGHKVVYVIKDLANANAFLDPGKFTYLQAPVFFSNAAAQRPVLCYPDLLQNVGYDTPTHLANRIRSWRALYDLLQPDLLVADHAPTALLSARDYAWPRVLFGTGFFAPPLTSPPPSLRPWINVPMQHLLSAENQVLQTINQALQPLEVTPLKMLADIFRVNENFLCTFKELDHYPQREGATYWGPRGHDQRGESPAWPTQHRQKIFAYIYPSYTHFPKLMQALREINASVLVHSPGISSAAIKNYVSANIEFSEQPVEPKYFVSQSDLVICHAGHGTVSRLLLGGKPLLLLPLHLEQMIIAKNVHDLGAGLYMLPETKNPNYKKLIKSLLSDESFTNAAREFAGRYAGFDLEQRNRRVADRCLSIMELEQDE
jgi:UDP:flavonoid glycosyltransferase YjiC (YdhE family)